MSRPVHEQLRRLETEVRDLRVLPAAAVRARGRRRGRRQTAAVMVGAAVVASAAGIAATRSLDRPPQSVSAPAAVTPSAGSPAAVTPAVPCVVTLPSDPAGVRVRVLGGGAPARQSDTTATGLRTRGFTVLPPTGGAANEPAGPTTVRYGPAAIGAATVLRAVLIGDATMRFDPARPDDTVDLTLGTTFARLATATEVNEALVAAGEPSAPPEC